MTSDADIFSEVYFQVTVPQKGLLIKSNDQIVIE